MGGFPEYIKLKNNDILRNLFQDIFFRDILVRNDFRSETQLKQFVAFVSSNIGVETSYNKLKDFLGLGSVNTVSDFVNACEASYLFFPLSKFDFSVKKQQIAPKKLYAVDNGILKLNSFSFSENKGRYLENIVFIELKRKGHEIFYHKVKCVCDFIIKKGFDITNPIQVCYELNDENQEREFGGILEVCKLYNLKKGLVLTYNQEDIFNIENIEIKVLPIRKWLLDNSKDI